MYSPDRFDKGREHATEQVASLDTTHKDVETYQKALSTAQRLIEESIKNKAEHNKELPGMTSQSARVVIDRMTWNKNYYDEEKNMAPFSLPPAEIVEAQRLVFNAYNPSDKLKKVQQNTFRDVLDLDDGSVVRSGLEIWSSADVNQKMDLLQRFKRDMCKQIGLADIEMKLSKPFGDGNAAYFKGSSSVPEHVLIEEGFLSRSGLFDALSVVTHELNHARQDFVVHHDDGLDDTAWFKLQADRESFISEAYFKQASQYSNEHIQSTYHSLPTEKDSFNAQAIFDAVLFEKASVYVQPKLDAAGCPNLTTTIACIKIAEHLTTQDDFMEPLSLNGLPEEIRAQAEVLLATYNNDLTALFSYSKGIRKKAKVVLSGIVT